MMVQSLTGHSQERLVTSTTEVMIMIVIFIYTRLQTSGINVIKGNNTTYH